MAESGTRAFDAIIEAGGGGGAFVSVPFDVEEAFGSGRPKVRALIDGHEYRGSIANMGSGHCLGIRKDVRAAIGKDVGDRIHVEIGLDVEPRLVDVPAELARELESAPDARERYEGLAHTHRRGFAEWVAGAKKQETRDRRAARAIEMLRAGETR